MGDLYGGTQGGLSCENAGVNDVYFVGWVVSIGHECERVLASHQPYLDVDTIE